MRIDGNKMVVTRRRCRECGLFFVMSNDEQKVCAVCEEGLAEGFRFVGKITLYWRGQRKRFSQEPSASRLKDRGER